MAGPRLRGGGSDPPPWELNHFPDSLALEVGKRLVREFAYGGQQDVGGETWERIFAEAISAEWVNTRAALADVRLANCAWSAKAVIVDSPLAEEEVTLISGRNNIRYSYRRSVTPEDDPSKVGKDVLGIWNARVAKVRNIREHMRTVVLLKSKDMLTFGIYEKPTIIYLPEQYKWEWNENENLIGNDTETGLRLFRWQVNGQQFSIFDKCHRAGSYLG